MGKWEEAVVSCPYSSVSSSSPGGRPVASALPKPESVALDPAALIAAALKRKFAKCNGESTSSNVDWGEKENTFRSRLDERDSSPAKVG